MRKLVSVSADAKVFIKKKLETAKIVRIAVGSEKTDYDETNKLVVGLQREVPKMFVYSEVLGETPDGKPIEAVERFNLKVNAKTGKPELKLGDKSSTSKIFAAFKVNDFNSLVGKSVMVNLNCSPKT